MNPKELDFKPGIVGAEPEEIEVLSQLEPGEKKISRRNFIAGSSLMLMGYLVGCRPSEAREPTPIVTETTGIPPTPTLEITPTPTEIPPTPTPTKEPIPTPEPTVTVEVVGFGMEDLTPEEQALVSRVETSYRTAANNQGLKEGIIYLTHGDEVGEIGAYFQDKTERFWYLVEREENKVLEEVPKFYDEPFWNPDEVRFEYPPSEGYIFIWKPKERIIWELTTNSAVAQWNPETSSWTMNPEPTPTPEPENWTYVEGVENVKFAEFNQEQLQMLKEAAVLVKQYDPERFALFEKEIDYVIFCGTDTNRGGRDRIWLSIYLFQPLSVPHEIDIALTASMFLGHEFQHSIQAMEGRDFNKICPNTGLKMIEIDAVKADIDMLRKFRQGMTKENQSILDEFIERNESFIEKDKDCTW